MATLFRTSDIIPIEIGELKVGISPLSFEQKMQVQSEMLNNKEQGPMRAAKLACQFAVKTIDGIQLNDGTKYQIDIKEGKLTDACWDDLQNIQETTKLITVCLNLINGIPKEFVDPQSGKKIDGVKIIEDHKGKKK